MRKTLQSTVVSMVIFAMVLALPLAILAEEGEITAKQAGYSENTLNKANYEDSEKVKFTGTLIEIGNTTAENTNVIVRVSANGATTDETVEVTRATKIINGAGINTKLDEWIAGDLLVVEAVKNKNSGEIIASKITNKSMNRKHGGVNGWIKAIRTDVNEIDVSWGSKVYTLKLASAKIVAGVKNPATISDLKVGDRVRSRVTEDNDGNKLTMNASIVVVLRRGNTLFMRVTRWNIPAKIVSMPDDCSILPATLTADVLTNRFYQKGDVNNLVGKPGDDIGVVVSDTTILKRKYLGNSLLCEFSEGDHINILGRYNETTGNIDAVLIKNNSIQALGVANKVGIVDSIDAANTKLTMHTVASSSKTYTITATTATKYYKRTASSTLETAQFSDIKADDRIRARGVLNRNSLNITASLIIILPAVTASSSCTDTDGGIEYLTKGNVNISGYGWDYCSDSATLMEQDCGTDSVGNTLSYGRTTAYTCPNGCLDGACLPAPTPSTACTDTDGGKNYDSVGTTFGRDSYGGDTSKTATYTDSCDGTERVMEFYCETINDTTGDGYVTMENHTCPNGCLDGACKASTTSSGTE